MADLGSSLSSVLQVPGLQELLNSAITQQRQADVLRTAVNQQAANMLPNSAFTRPNMAAIPQANYTTPPSSGMNPVVAALLGAGGGAGLTLLLQHLLGNKSGGGSGGGNGAGGGSGPGSSIQFGGNSVAGGLNNLLHGHSWNYFNNGLTGPSQNSVPALSQQTGLTPDQLTSFPGWASPSQYGNNETGTTTAFGQNNGGPLVSPFPVNTDFTGWGGGDGQSGNADNSNDGDY